MSRKGIWKYLAGLALLSTLIAAVAVAQDNEYGYGMMGGYGMGPGMMRGYGMGPGMMRGYGGYGMGPEMMGGYGGLGPLGALNLSDAQRDRITKILEADRQQHWAVMGKMMDDADKLRELLAEERPNPEKVGALYGQISVLRQQIIVAHVKARNEVQNVLTAKQREQLQQWRRGAWASGWGPHPGYGWGPHPGYPGGDAGGVRP